MRARQIVKGVAILVAIAALLFVTSEGSGEKIAVIVGALLGTAFLWLAIRRPEHVLVVALQAGYDESRRHYRRFVSREDERVGAWRFVALLWAMCLVFVVVGIIASGSPVVSLAGAVAALLLGAATLLPLRRRIRRPGALRSKLDDRVR
jgi:hypothetical protein